MLSQADVGEDGGSAGRASIMAPPVPRVVPAGAYLCSIWERLELSESASFYLLPGAWSGFQEGGAK